MRDKFKVLIVPSWFPLNGNQRGSYFEDQVLLLLSSGYDVRVFYPEIVEKTKKYFLKTLFSKKFSELFSKDITDELNHSINGVAVRIVDYTFLPDPLRYYLTNQIILRKAKKYFLEENWRCDIVHGFSVFGGGMFVSEISKEFNTRSIITEHQVFNLAYYPKYFQKKIINCLSSVQSLFAVSEHLKRLMYSQYIERPIYLFNNYVKDIFFNKNPILTKNDPLAIAYVSYDHYLKGNDVFFDSLKILKRKFLNQFKITIVGNFSSDQIEKIIDLLSDSVLKNNIVFSGIVNEYQLAEIFKNSHLLVSTSRAETFGLAVREALAVGIPVVCTRSGGVDVDITNQNGYLITSDRPYLIAEAVYKVYDEYDTYNSKVIKADVEIKYGKKVSQKSFDSIYGIENNI